MGPILDRASYYIDLPVDLESRSSYVASNW